MHMQAIIKAFRSAATLAVQQVKDSSISIAGKDEEEKRDMLQKCASTTLNSKLVGPSPVLCCSGMLLLLGTCVHVLEVVVLRRPYQNCCPTCCMYCSKVPPHHLFDLQSIQDMMWPVASGGIRM